MAQLTWFTNQQAFEQFNRDHGKILKGIENYEESTLPPNSVVAINDPLWTLPNGPFPNGLTGLRNLQVQSNTLGGNPTVPSPSGVDGLAVASAGFVGAVSDIVLSNTFVHSHDLIWKSRDKTGVGGNLIDALGQQLGIDFRVYDIANNFLGLMHFPANIQGSQFAGVWSEIPIGRVNLFSTGGGAEGMDNIQGWVPEPASLTLLALGGLALIRRRR